MHDGLLDCVKIEKAREQCGDANSQDCEHFDAVRAFEEGFEGLMKGRSEREDIDDTKEEDADKDESKKGNANTAYAWI